MRAIFISYRRDDTEGQAGRLFDDLARHFGEDSVFMDVAGIEPGRDFRRVIDEHVASCGVLLSMIGKNWLDTVDESGRRRLEDPSDFVRLETASALRRDIPVVPVLVHGARMPRAEQLPDDLAELAYRNGVELSHARWDSDVQVLVKALSPYVELSQKNMNPSRAGASSLSQNPPPADGAVSLSGSRSAKRRLPTLVAAAVATLVIGAGAYVWHRNAVDYAEVLRRAEETRKAAEEFEAKKRAEAKAAADAQEEKKRAEEKALEAEGKRRAQELALAEKREAERRERERAAAEKLEAERRAREIAEAERRERERAAAEKAEAERRTREIAEAERREAEKREAESRAREKALAEERDRLRQARDKALADERERNRQAQERAAALQRARWPSYNFPPPNGGLLVYTIMPDGNPACASYDGGACLWGVSYDQIDFKRMKPLACGPEHRSRWGTTGYEDPRHWCSLARRLRADRR